MWAGNTSSVLRREDPATWVGPLPEADRTSTLDGLNDRTSQWRLRELSGEEDLLQLLPGRVFPWLEQLLGKGQVVEPVPTSTAADPDPRGTRLRGWPVWGGKELRGAYCNLPSERPPAAPPLATAARAGAHVDPEPMHLVVSGYLDRVPQGGGGLALFPTSHRLLYEAVPESADLARYSILHPPHPEHGCAAFVLPGQGSIKDKLQSIEPVEFHGEEGDVVMWHGRMFHSATPNYCVDPPQIRQMIVYDVYKKSVYERAFGGDRYDDLPRPNASPPPNIQSIYELGELLPALPPPPPRAEGPGLFEDWSEVVRRLEEQPVEQQPVQQEAAAAAARL